ncbi:Sterol O-acyltransferase 2 [Nakaseomyces bracarensis]|uniref:O-acyltransferase n=1 Tax=Nakaseomyces bracarensis TaxID=273131 RepID=A0ABR4NYU0_9SACH
MGDELLDDKRFIRIQKLNRPNDGKRHSLQLDSEEHLYEHKDVKVDSQRRHLDDGYSSSGSSVTSSPEKSSPQPVLFEKDAEIVEKPTDSRDESLAPGEVEVKVETKQTITMLDDKKKAHDDTEDRRVAHITKKFKNRYQKGTQAFRSYFDDVAFEYRPSIFDASINEPYQTKFAGPTLEASIKKKEKELRQLRTEHKRQLDSGEGPISWEETLLTSNFSGIYVAIWMTLALGVLKSIIDYYCENGTLKDSEIFQFMTKDLWKVAYADLVMYLTTYFSVAVQYLCKWKILSWSKQGWVIIAIFEAWYLLYFMYYTEHILRLHWVAKIFLFLHSLVLLMKMHSYSFYNGYLWEIKDELDYSTKALAKYKETAKQDIVETLEKSIEFCTSEIKSQSKYHEFPNNITLQNYFTYSMFPSLVYQIEYPRTKKIRWHYVVEKVCAIFGTIIVMMTVAQIFMYPVAIRALSIRDNTEQSLFEKAQMWPRLLIDIVPSFIIMYLLVFYLIWDAILNCIAELTCFGDRYFYGDWWNCVDWAEFSRIWNVPVHKFLVRHVYHSSMSALKLNRHQATLFTFFLSSIIHEMAMYVIFKRLRFYLFCFQMFQLPLVAISNTPFMRKRTVIGNVIFWLGICIGPSLICTIYLTF